MIWKKLSTKTPKLVVILHKSVVWQAQKNKPFQQNLDFAEREFKKRSNFEIQQSSKLFHAMKFSYLREIKFRWWGGFTVNAALYFALHPFTNHH